MGRFRFNSSLAALGLAATALFVALGGPAWAGSLIGTGQIRNGAITSQKIGHHQVKSANLAAGAVKTSNIAAGAVTAAQVKRGSLTAADVAPGTFLGTASQAEDSKDLGGKPASDYLVSAGGLSGSSGMVSNSITVAAGVTAPLLNLGIAVLNGGCGATGVPTLTLVSEVPSLSLVDWATSSGAPLTDVTATDGLATGTSYTEPNASGGTQAVTFQAAFDDNGASHVATAWTTGQAEATGSCAFVGQALTTG